MIRRMPSQRSLVEVLLPGSEKLGDPVLQRIDAELEDEVLVDLVVTVLAWRHPQSQLKHLNDWSFDECESEVRANLVCRAFCRVEGDGVPDAKTLIRLAQVLDGPRSSSCSSAW